MGFRIPAIPKDAAKESGFRDKGGRVVIIGAGASGLMAANALKYMGVGNFIVLEASDRIGGRLKKTDDFHNEVPLDVGAEWIHAENEQIVKDLLVFDADDDAETNENGLQSSEFIKYQPDLYFRKNNYKLLKCLYQETKWKRSTWWHWLDKYVYKHVSEKVFFGKVVKGISYSDPNQVTVTTESGEIYKADKVIVTIPLACLKQNTVQFDPPLPTKKLEAIEKVEMPPGFRIFIEMKDKFYPDMTVDNNGILRQIMDGDNVCIMYDALYGKELEETQSNSNSKQQNILGYVAIGSKYTKDMTNLCEEELVKVVLAKIDRVFGAEAGTKNYVKHTLQNWTLEPYIQGTYSYPSSKYLKRDLRDTIGDARNVLFSGEHTSVPYHSTVVGAAIEGRQAAVEAVSGKAVVR